MDTTLMSTGIGITTIGKHLSIYHTISSEKNTQRFDFIVHEIRE
jgi:hypothetical protein